MTAGTVFHGTRVPLRVWFLGIFFLARHKTGISARQFQRDTGLGSYQTAWTVLHKLRSGLVAHPARCLSGDVEADEIYIGGHRPGRLRGTFHGVSPKHLQRYLDEFVFRFDRRWRETELFIRVLHRALDTAPCPYHQLTAERIG